MKPRENFGNRAAGSNCAETPHSGYSCDSRTLLTRDQTKSNMVKYRQTIVEATERTSGDGEGKKENGADRSGRRVGQTRFQEFEA
ncbi:hypothetical protein QLX08_003491 [Tetragonisca angustula]|uniref:Uncharacterized protein n=1 Tax=Tetragonisca angustula TaxID=166442 RepID=A0AAW1A6N5_9HYME